MRPSTIALFGAAEKGEYHTALLCRSLTDLEERFGQPPPESCGLYFAVQALLFNQQLLFIRVEEEGFSKDDYLLGLDLLRDKYREAPLTAIALPGVGDEQIINASMPICSAHGSLLLITEGDLYDYLTAQPQL